ncbi:MAG TPA: dipeptidase PepE [Phnomibacter sp.]|nr:dipeptidase PepE [Phnomibacter sp.]
MQLLIVSTSTVHGQPYLSYLLGEIGQFFEGKERVLFIPYARPSGISHDAYTAKAKEVFDNLGLEVRGAHTFPDAVAAANWAQGFFTGGGNTFLLLKMLYETGLYDAIDARVRAGVPYMGTSAGCNVCGLTIGTTNDMPIVHPATLKAFGWVPFNLNPHYIDPLPDSTHMGETRETRIAEFHHFNGQPVLGLREGSWLRADGPHRQLKGPFTARWFQAGRAPKELEPGFPQELQGHWSDQASGNGN